MSSSGQFEQLSVASEFFVDADEAARFLKINRRTLLHWARQGVLPAHPLGLGSRKTWRFLVSELGQWLRAQVTVG
jgi:excisionase family DNA binding protein